MTDRTKELVDEFSQILDGKSEVEKLLHIIDNLNTSVEDLNEAVNLLAGVVREQGKTIEKLERRISIRVNHVDAI